VSCCLFFCDDWVDVVCKLLVTNAFIIICVLKLGGHKAGTLGEFSVLRKLGILGEFCTNSVENCSKLSGITRCGCHGAKMLLTFAGVLCSKPHWGSLKCCPRLPLFQLLYVVITCWKASFWLWKKRENFGLFSLTFGHPVKCRRWFQT